MEVIAEDEEERRAEDLLREREELEVHRKLEDYLNLSFSNSSQSDQDEGGEEDDDLSLDGNENLLRVAGKGVKDGRKGGRRGNGNETQNTACNSEDEFMGYWEKPTVLAKLAPSSRSSSVYTLYTAKRIVREEHLIREVLLMFFGLNSNHISMCFKPSPENGNDIVYIDGIFSLESLSSGALHSLMNDFAEIGSMAKKISVFSTNINYQGGKDVPVPRSWLDQALKNSCVNQLGKFRGKLVELEGIIQRGVQTADHSNWTVKSTSLLAFYKLVKEMADPLYPILEIIDMVNSLKEESSLSVRNGKILSNLYNLLLSSQEMCKEREIATIYSFFRDACQTLFQLLGYGFSSPMELGIEEETFLVRATSQQLQSDPLFPVVREEACPVFLLGHLKEIQCAYRSCLMINVFHAKCKELGGQFLDLMMTSFTPNPNTLEQSKIEEIDILVKLPMESWLLNLPDSRNKPKLLVEEFTPKSLNFEVEFRETLNSLFKPIISSINKEMQIFMFEKTKIQEDLHSFSSLLFFLEGDVTNNFCDSLAQLEKMEDWRIQLCLRETLQEAGCTTNLDVNKMETTALISSKPGSNYYFDRVDLFYNVPWPANQVLTVSAQRRYLKIFRLLANIYDVSKVLNENRSDISKRRDRLYLLSFIFSISTYCMQSVIIPITSQIQWKDCLNLDELLLMHQGMLEKIESGLHLTNHRVTRLIEEMLDNCRSGRLDEDLMILLRDALASIDANETSFTWDFSKRF